MQCFLYNLVSTFVDKTNVWHCYTFSSSDKNFDVSTLCTEKWKLQLETSTVDLKNIPNQLVPHFYMWYSSSVWKTSKTDSLPIPLSPNHLIILLKKHWEQFTTTSPKYSKLLQAFKITFKLHSPRNCHKSNFSHLCKNVHSMQIRTCHLFHLS